MPPGKISRRRLRPFAATSFVSAMSLTDPNECLAWLGVTGAGGLPRRWTWEKFGCFSLGCPLAVTGHLDPVFELRWPGGAGERRRVGP